MIAISELINAALHGTRRAGAAIVAERIGKGNSKVDYINKAGDQGPVSKADILSQIYLTDSIVSQFPELTASIHGEEGTIAKDVEEELVREEHDLVRNPTLSLPSIEDIIPLIPQSSRTLESRGLTLFIDPLDGTKEFINNSETVPMTMVGICYEDNPIIGILYQPFLQSLIVGIVNSGCYKLMYGRLMPLEEHNSHTGLILTTTQSHYTDELNEKLLKIQPEKILKEGGAGYKSVNLIENNAQVYCYPAKGTSLWDTCAPEACILSMGGKITDCNGNPINYNVANREGYLGNDDGILATNRNAVITHEEIVSRLLN